jgi:hypothetical protein
MRQCPQLADLWSIAATQDIGVKVILPQGASEAFSYDEKLDIYGNYECDITPFPSIFEDYQINCYKVYDPEDGSNPNVNINVMGLNDVQAICDWIAEQNDIGNLPQITGRKVVSIECNPIVPQIRMVNTQEGIIAYFITVRIRYVNPLQGRSITYESNDLS